MLDIFDLIAQVETKRNFQAFRFEPDVYARISASRTDAQKDIIAKIIDAHGGPANCSWHTALAIYSTSYGAVQLMGFNLYGPVCGFDESTISFMLPGEDGILPASVELCQRVNFSHLLVSMKLDKATPENLASSAALRDLFAITYNGSTAYAAAIVVALQHFAIPVTP